MATRPALIVEGAVTIVTAKHLANQGCKRENEQMPHPAVIGYIILITLHATACLALLGLAWYFHFTREPKDFSEPDV